VFFLSLDTDLIKVIVGEAVSAELSPLSHLHPLDINDIIIDIIIYCVPLLIYTIREVLSMKENSFYAMLSRMKYINRWGLMRNSRNENLCEHSLEVAFIAHALGLINNRYFGGDIDPERLAVLAMFHDTTEIITGDMPTPVKYHSSVIRSAYSEVEKIARDELLKGLPEKLRDDYSGLLLECDNEEREWQYIKAADKISAWLKCVDEKNMGNTDFADAEKTIKSVLDKMELPEVKFFMKEFAPAYGNTLDHSSGR